MIFMQSPIIVTRKEHKQLRLFTFCVNAGGDTWMEVGRKHLSCLLSSLRRAYNNLFLLNTKQQEAPFHLLAVCHSEEMEFENLILLSPERHAAAKALWATAQISVMLCIFCIPQCRTRRGNTCTCHTSLPLRAKMLSNGFTSQKHLQLTRTVTCSAERVISPPGRPFQR